MAEVALTGAVLSATRRTNPAVWGRAVIVALRANAGVVARAATDLGVHPRTLRRWLKRHPDLAYSVTLHGPGRPAGEG